MTNAAVRARVRWLIADQFARRGITTERVYDELEAIAFSNARHYGTVTPEGGVVLYPWEDMPEHAGVVVAEIAQTVTQYGGTRRLKLFDKLEALALIAKLKRMDEESDTAEERAQAIHDALLELRAATDTEPDE